MENPVKTILPSPENPVKLISPSTEMELRRILLDNLVCGFGCLFLSAILCSITLFLFGANLIFLFIFVLFSITWLGVIINANLAALFEEGKGYDACRWCRNKAVANFLMLHYQNRSRTVKVLQVIDNELDSMV